MKRAAWAVMHDDSSAHLANLNTAHPGTMLDMGVRGTPEPHRCSFGS